MKTLVVAILCVLSTSTLAAPCPGDLNGDGETTVDEIVQGVNAALFGCIGGTPNPTPTPDFLVTRLLEFKGRWRFTTIIGPQTLVRNFKVTTLGDGGFAGAPNLIGFEEVDRTPVSVEARATEDLVYTLERAGGVFCEEYLFTLTSPNTASGVLRYSHLEAFGCGLLVEPEVEYPMTAVRLP